MRAYRAKLPCATDPPPTIRATTGTGTGLGHDAGRAISAPGMSTRPTGCPFCRFGCLMGCRPLSACIAGSPGQVKPTTTYLLTLISTSHDISDGVSSSEDRKADCPLAVAISAAFSHVMLLGW